MKRGTKTIIRNLTRTRKARAKTLQRKGHYVGAIQSKRSALIHAALLSEVRNASA